MHYTCSMHIVEPSKNLIHKELEMLSRQLLIASQNLVQISVHELKHNVNMVKFLSCHGHQNSLEVDDILMLEQFQQVQFSQNPLRDYFMLKRL